MANIKDIMWEKETRKTFCEYSYSDFVLYYFCDSLHFAKVAPFHKTRCVAVDIGYNIFLDWFRESAKTFYMWLAKDIYDIVYRKKRFICAFSYDKQKSRDYLFKIAVQLQTNKRIIEDFWQLFFETNTERQSTKKGMGEFITSNDVKLKAFSMWTSMRWEFHMSKDWMVRPDSVLFDDIDVIDSVKNKRIINDNYRFLEDEVFGWLADYCQIRILWNVIREDWLNPRLKKNFTGNPKWEIFSQWIYDKDWNITWERFVETDEEANEKNKDIVDPKKRYISLEWKRRDLKDISYNQNFLWIPYKVWDRLIKEQYIRRYDTNIAFDYMEIGIDPAFSEKTQSDEFSITVTGFKKAENNIHKYVEKNVSIIWEQKTNENICKIVSNLWIYYKDKWLRNVKVEWNNGWEVFAKMFRNPNLMQGQSVNTTVITSTKDKFSRAKEFEWDFERWEIHFRMWDTEELVDQLLDFTGEPTKKDDRVDSFINSLIDAWSNFYFEIC